MGTFEYVTTVPAPLVEVFAWLRRPGALWRLTPPWLPLTVRQQVKQLEVGDVLTLHPGRVESRITELLEPHDGAAMFVDEHHSRLGHWRHEHHVTAVDEATTRIDDRMVWKAWDPPGIVKRLNRAFDYRSRVLPTDLAVHRGVRPLQVVVAGASGTLGTDLVALLRTGGHQVRTLVRRPTDNPHEISWNPTAGTIHAAALADCDVVVNLAGEPLFGRWTSTKMRNIRESRIRGTALLATTLAELAGDGRARTFISASAIGYYAPTPTPVGEEGQPGSGFLAELVADWEAAAEPAATAGVRVVHPRLGVVLTPRGGFLRQQLPAFRVGLGAFIGDGSHPLSWVGVDDALYLLYRAIVDASIDGPLNITAPALVSGREFAAILGDVLHRPGRLRLPLAAVRLALGGAAANELAAADQRVVPAAALAAGFEFHYPTLRPALAHPLGR